MAKYKVGDRVKFVSGKQWGTLQYGYIGTVITTKDLSDVPYNYDYGIEFDNECDGHTCKGIGKDNHCFWLRKEQIELIQSEPTLEPTPEIVFEPIIEKTERIENYDNACWYCRKGGLVDLYLDGAMGICPSCKRVCNAQSNILPTFEPAKKPAKSNKALTTEELRALPDGAKVYIVWVYDAEINGRSKTRWEKSGWGRTDKEGDCVRWSKHSWEHIENNYRCFDAYLEEPKEIELPF